MKIHISNLYNFNQNDALVKKQHRIAEAGLALGYREMGIFSFPVETDTPQELSKRLDGVIAALEPDDVVLLQLPTRNGVEYEKLLAQKCKAYRNTKLILLFHDMNLLETIDESQESYRELCKLADAVVVPTERDIIRMSAIGVSAVVPLNDFQKVESLSFSEVGGYDLLCKSDFYVQKAMMDAVEIAFDTQNRVFQMKSKQVENEIHIGFGLHDKTGDYSVWVGVAIQSIIEHTNSPLCFHILHDNTLNQKNKSRLVQTAAQDGNRIVFHELEESMWKNTEEQMATYTIGALFRIMLPTCLPDVSKVIYLDADILVNRDIKELWDINIDEYSLAAVQDVDVASGLVRPVVVKNHEVEAGRYFNSGVLYMNLDQIRQKGDMCNTVLDCLKRIPKSNLPDQDALNVIYGKDTLLIDHSWNCFVRPIQNAGKRELENKVYHFVGTRCILYSFTGVDWKYYETILRTPWGMEIAGKQLRKSIGRVNQRLDQYEKLIMQLSNGNKKYIFYGEETNAMRNMYEILTIQEGDYRILEEVEESEESILSCKHVSDLDKEEDEFIIFVLPEADRGRGVEKLERMGLISEKDFFVIPCLLPPAQGGYM